MVVELRWGGSVAFGSLADDFGGEDEFVGM